MNNRMKFYLLVVSALLISLSLEAYGETLLEKPKDEMTITASPKKGVTNFTCLKRKMYVAKTPGHWWMGTRGGLVRLNEDTFAVERIYTPADGLAGTPVTALAADGDVLWVGTYYGISQLDSKADTLRTTPARGHSWRFELDDSNGHVWALSRRIVLLFEKRSGDVRSFELGEKVVCVQRKGSTLWTIARKDRSDYLLTRLETTTGEKITQSLELPDNYHVRALIVGKHNLWILAGLSPPRPGYALFRIDRKSFKVVPQGITTGLAHDSVQQVITKDSEVWVRTSGKSTPQASIAVGGRLCRYDRSKQSWQTFPSISGFKHDEPTCLAEINGDLWVATRAYERTKEMVMGWGMMPMKAEAPVLEALTLNRFLSKKQEWQTFNVPSVTDYDRIIDIELLGTQLWFLIKRYPVAQTWQEPRTQNIKPCVISGYIDLKLPDSKPILLDDAPLPSPGIVQWGQRDVMDLLITGNVPWVRHQQDFWRKTAEGEWQKLEFDSPLPDSRQIRLFTVKGETFALCAIQALRFEPQAKKWSKWGIDRPWTMMHIMKDPSGTWWLSAAMDRVYLPRDSDRNDEDRKPLQSGLFRSKDGVSWEVPSIAPWTWQQQDVEGKVRYLPVNQVKKTPRDIEIQPFSRRPRPHGQAKAGEGVSCVQSDGKRVWVGTFGEGVFCLENNRWRRLWPKSQDATTTRTTGWKPRAAEDTVISMALDGDSLWIATMAGLRRYWISKGVVEKVHNASLGLKTLTDLRPSVEATRLAEIGHVVAKAAGRIWFSYGRTQKDAGIYYLQEDNKNWECAIPDTSARCFAGMYDVVWIGTGEGLLRYNTKTGEKKLFTTRDGLVGNYILSVAVDNRFIWVGTRDGISRLDRTLFF